MHMLSVSIVPKTWVSCEAKVPEGMVVRLVAVAEGEWMADVDMDGGAGVSAVVAPPAE